MITILPLFGDELEAAQGEFALPESCQILAQSENGINQGYIAFEASEIDLNIIFLNYNEPWMADGLIRAAISYAENHQLSFAVTSLDKDKKYFKTVGFKEENGLLSLSIEKFFGGSHANRGC